ncbi:MAG TPA: flagellar basal body L-ring protein FlgH [Burkholderiales bacterium]|nr:flagellar basal body L-ring protein FlgH [Burkholderiales bacterium]
MRGFLFPMLVVLSGCITTGVEVREPTTARPAPVARVPQQNGAIFQDSVSYRPLFEDRRARYVGDTLTIAINEQTTASRDAANSASRDSSVNFGVPVVQGLPFKGMQGAQLQAAAKSDLNSKDQASANNLFTGNITVTVVDVLPNGNLVVAGEKRIGIGIEIETLRFSGVVNPVNIVNGNTVNSTNVADARIEADSHSNVKPEQVLGFLGRFFLSFLPFR